MTADAWHGIATVAWILTRGDMAYADEIEAAHVHKGAATAKTLLRERFSEERIEAAARKMLRAIASGRLPAIYEEHMEDGPS